MNQITTTDLRTKSSQLIHVLKGGGSLSLIHRSKIVGKIIPTSDVSIKRINSKSLQDKINRLGFPALSSEEIDRRYKDAMMQKHGKNFR